MNKPPKKPPGAVKRLCYLTYPQLAEWTGLQPRTVQTYAAAGQFDPASLESCLRWVNSKRSARGWPLIGDPSSPAEAVSRPISGPDGSDTAEEPDRPQESGSGGVGRIVRGPDGKLYLGGPENGC